MNNLINKFSITDVLVIIICGIGLSLSILKGEQDLAMAIGGGLVGYLGGATTQKGGE